MLGPEKRGARQHQHHPNSFESSRQSFGRQQRGLHRRRRRQRHRRGPELSGDLTEVEIEAFDAGAASREQQRRSEEPLAASEPQQRGPRSPDPALPAPLRGRLQVERRRPTFPPRRRPPALREFGRIQGKIESQDETSAVTFFRGAFLSNPFFH